MTEPTTGLRAELQSDQFGKIRAALMTLPAASLEAFFAFGAGLAAPATDSYDDRNAFLDALEAECGLGGDAVTAGE